MMPIRMMVYLRLLALALLCAGVVAGPASAIDAPAILADEGKGERGQGERDGGKDNWGKGNDDKDKGKGKDKKDKGNGKGNGKGNDRRGGQVQQAAAYRVEVECAYDEGADETTCAFIGVAPAGARDVSHVDLPEEEVCAEVVGGEHEYVDPDPNTRVVGYKSKGSEGTFSLVMAGEVTTGGTATYWFKTGDGVFPATGPGLVCGEPAEQRAVEVTPEAEAGEGEVTADAPATLVVRLQADATVEAAAGTGAILVRAYVCAEDPASAEYDWYGECAPGVEGIPFSLARREGAELAAAADGATDGEGLLRFEPLQAGTYHLEAIDTVWCHAESDNVDERGELVVAAGVEVTVWIFFCGAEATK